MRAAADNRQLRGGDPDPAVPRSPRGNALTRLGLIGVPSSAGAHGPGQEKAPAALREAGLLGALFEAGLAVDDLGGLPPVRFEPGARNRKQQSAAQVAAVGNRVAAAGAAAPPRGVVPL